MSPDLTRLLAAAGVLLTAAACAGPSAPTPAPKPQSCAEAVAIAKRNPLLRIHQRESGGHTRMSANAYLQTAEGAAINGDEDICWWALRRSSLFIGLVPGVRFPPGY